MLEKNVTLQLELGLHARPSAYICDQLCKMDLESAEYIREGSDPVNMRSVIGLLSSCLVPNETVLVKIKGKDEVKAMALIERIFASESSISLTPKK